MRCGEHGGVDVGCEATTASVRGKVAERGEIAVVCGESVTVTVTVTVVKAGDARLFITAAAAAMTGRQSLRWPNWS